MAGWMDGCYLLGCLGKRIHIYIQQAAQLGYIDNAEVVAGDVVAVVVDDDDAPPFMPLDHSA